MGFHVVWEAVFVVFDMANWHFDSILVAHKPHKGGLLLLAMLAKLLSMLLGLLNSVSLSIFLGGSNMETLTNGKVSLLFSPSLNRSSLKLFKLEVNYLHC